MTKDPTKRKRRLGVAGQVFVALGLGILTGVFFGEEVGFLRIGGEAFIALLQITVIPYVMVALITSLGRLTLDDAKALALKAGSILLVLWAIGLVIVLSTPLALPDWPSASFFSASEVEPSEPIDFLELYIPSNVFFALSNAVVPAIVVFSIMFGLGLINVRHKERVLELLSTVGDVLMAITRFVGRLAPYGVFAITASAAGTIDVADLGRLQVYIVIYVSMALVLSLWVIPGLIATLTPLSHASVLRAVRGPLITAFATGNVLIVLPVLAADGKRLMEELEGTSGQGSERAESSIDILIPAAFPFPNLGAVLVLVFVLFGGWYVGSAVPVDQYPVLSLAGLASLFGGAVLALPFLFDLLRLPADLFQVYITIDVIGRRFGTLVAAMHILAVALIGACALQGRVTIRPVPLLRFAVISIVLIAAALAGVRALYTHVYVGAYTKDRLLASLHLIEDPQPHTVHHELPDNPTREPGTSALARFKERGVLRVCYLPDDYPSAFFNDAGALVGFDIEMAHRFGRHLGAPLELLPAGSIAGAAEILDAGRCDVFMSLMAVSPAHIEQFSMTSPVRNQPLGLIIRDHRRQEFRDWDAIRRMKELRVAVIDDPSAHAYLRRFTPNATPVPFGDQDEIEQLLAVGGKDLDAIAMFAEEAAAWTIRHPEFAFVVPAPTIFIPSGYAVARGDVDMLTYLDSWLLNARADGTVDRLYRYWMLGQVAETQPARWSVLRDVLGYGD